MKITLTPENCNFENPFIIEECMDSQLRFEISFENHIPTAQSKEKVKQQLLSTLSRTLQQFKWIIFGPVWVELEWYIDSADRQETDAVGDLDNITKPLLDTFCGIEGLMIDDSQIKSLDTRWFAKNGQQPHSFVKMNVRYLNEEVFFKEKLWLIQYNNAMCFPIDLDPTITSDLKKIKIFAKAKRAKRTSASTFKSIGLNLDFVLISSQKDFHRTRLSKIPQQRIFKLPDS